MSQKGQKGVVNAGFGNMVMASRIVAILGPGSAPMRRLREEAKKAGRLVDATQGRKCRSMLVADSGHIILSAVQPETLCQRYETSEAEPANILKEVAPSIG